MTSFATNWSQLGGLMFVARKLVDGLYAGRHLSPQTGAGLDFHDYRAYSPGDALSDLDWKLLGRTDRFYIKRYRRQTDLQVYVMLDASASMGFRGLDAKGQTRLASPDHPSKYQVGCLLASAIAFLTLRQSDRAGLGLFADKLIDHLPPMGTPSHLQQICTHLEQHAPVPGSGNLRASLNQLQGVLRRRGLIVVISDLLDEPTEFFQGIGPLRHQGHEVMVLQVLTPQERQLALPGDLQLQLVDIETHLTAQARLGAIRADYTRLMTQHIDVIRQGCQARGMDYQLVTTDGSPLTALRRYLSRRASLGTSR